MADAQDAVERYAGSYMNKLGSSSRNAADEKTPPVIGTVTVLPVRSSVIVMVSAMWHLLGTDREQPFEAFSPTSQARRTVVSPQTLRV